MEKQGLVGEIYLIVSDESIFYESLSDLVVDLHRYIDTMGIMAVRPSGYTYEARRTIGKVLRGEFGDLEPENNKRDVNDYIF